MSQRNLLRLQRTQNAASRVVLMAKRRENSAALLKKLHWLPVTMRINFKIALTTFKVLTQNQPIYLRNLLKAYTSARALRSASDSRLIVPFAKTRFYSRAFEVYAPTLWNSLPLNIRDSVTQSVSIDAFKRNLKTVLFAEFCRSLG